MIQGLAIVENCEKDLENELILDIHVTGVSFADPDVDRTQNMQIIVKNSWLVKDALNKIIDRYNIQPASLGHEFTLRFIGQNYEYISLNPDNIILKGIFQSMYYWSS